MQRCIGGGKHGLNFHLLVLVTRAGCKGIRALKIAGDASNISDYSRQQGTASEQIESCNVDIRD